MLKEIQNTIASEKELTEEQIEWATDYFADEIPYGIVTGDEGTVEEWLYSQLS